MPAASRRSGGPCRSGENARSRRASHADALNADQFRGAGSDSSETSRAGNGGGALMELDYIDHFAITVKNLQTSFDWYHKTFGFEIFHQWQTTWLIQLGTMKIGLFERPQAGQIADINNTIAFQHVAFHVSAEEFIQAEIQLSDVG